MKCGKKKTINPCVYVGFRKRELECLLMVSGSTAQMKKWLLWQKSSLKTGKDFWVHTLIYMHTTVFPQRWNGCLCSQYISTESDLLIWFLLQNTHSCRLWPLSSREIVWDQEWFELQQNGSFSKQLSLGDAEQVSGFTAVTQKLHRYT